MPERDKSLIFEPIFKERKDRESCQFSPAKNRNSVNEILVKVEMNRFKNLVKNKLPMKNALLSADKQRVFPLSKA